MSAMSLRVRVTSLLAVASLTSACLAASARAQGTGGGDAALAHAVAAAHVSLARGLSDASARGKPISGKYEMEDGKLQLSVYTARGGHYWEVVVDHSTGRIVKAEEIKEGEDLTAAKAQDAAMAKVRPGVPAQEIDRAARAVITKGGYGQYFTHRLGHGMGMDGHEPTWMVEGNTKVLEPGYVFSVEPGIYMPGMWGVRIEDDYMCTASGGELLSRRAPSV